MVQDIFYKGFKLENITGMCGEVVSSEDWLNISKKNYPLYRVLTQTDIDGKCYATTLAIAKYVSDCILVYGAIEKEDGNKTAHVILKKASWVYDSNMKHHFKYDEYIQTYNFEIFCEKIPPKENFKEFLQKFFEGGFKQWCEERNVEVDTSIN